MPWKAVMVNGKPAVVKKGSGDLVNYSSSMDKAQAQVRAMYANYHGDGANERKPKKGRSAKTQRLKSAAARRIEKGNKKKKHATSNKGQY